MIGYYLQLDAADADLVDRIVEAVQANVAAVFTEHYGPVDPASGPGDDWTEVHATALSDLIARVLIDNPRGDR